MIIAAILPLLERGVELQINLKMVGEDVQMDIIPRSSGDNKTGISIPAKSVVGSAQEIDANLVELLAQYGKPAASIAEQIKQVEQDMEQAAQAAKKSAEAKAQEAKGKGSGKPVQGKAKVLPELMDDDLDSSALMPGGADASSNESTATVSENPFGGLDEVEV